jgi:exo-beta-1,3-glucanase (GH17 family)
LGDVVEDFKVLSQLTPRVRLYGMDCNVAEMSLDAIDLLGLDMSLVLTIWVDDDEETYVRQVRALLDLLKRYDAHRIIGVSVGNEAIFRKDLSRADLVARMKAIRAQMAACGFAHVPVYTTELADNYDQELVEASDRLLGNIHPYFAGVPSNEAAVWSWQFFKSQFGRFETPAIISETGWPTQGAPRGNAVPSVEGLQRFLDDFICHSNRYGLQYYFFEAFDAVWKEGQDPVEKSWGLLDRYRRPKVRIPNCTLIDVGPMNASVVAEKVLSHLDQMLEAAKNSTDS